MKRRPKELVGISLLSLSLCMFAPVTIAAESIRLIAVDASSTSALWVKVFVEYFIPEVDRRLAEN